MFGPAFLVNPVTQPMYYTTGSTPLADVPKQRAVYLPAGYDWYDFWTDRRLTGGQVVQADAALDILPLYVRAGSIVPMGQPMQYADELPDAAIELHIYPGCDGSFLLYEDEGDSYNYEQGAFSTIHHALARYGQTPSSGCTHRVLPRYAGAAHVPGGSARRRSLRAQRAGLRRRSDHGGVLS